MKHRKRVVASLVVIGVVGMATQLVPGCTDVGLYQWKHDPFQANKITVSGTVCSDDPRQRNFPVKIMFVIDSSMSVSSDVNDPTGYRGKAVIEVLEDLGKNANFHFGLVSFAGKPRNLLTDEAFTQDQQKLLGAATAIQGGVGAGGCFAGRCRDVRGAFALASSLITGDILASDPGENSRTSYVIIMFSNGPPVPAIGRCACRDRQTETTPCYWSQCPWTECDGCKVQCPPNATCKDTLCYPVCNPACTNDQFCDSDYLCKDLDPDGPGVVVGNPTVPALSNNPVSIPDTFNHWVLPEGLYPGNGFTPPADDQNCQSTGFGLDLTQIRPADPADSLGPCVKACVFYPGGGHTDSCEERVMVAAVRELKLFARKNGAAQLQVHTVYLPDKIDYNDPNLSVPPSFAPLCGDATSEEARSVRLFSEMAFAGGGGFLQYSEPSTIDYRDVNLHTSRDALVIKELVVTNANVITTATGIEADTDQDGLPDVTEKEIGTCLSDKDTDGDGIGDAVEIKVLASNPLKPDDPVECIDLEWTNSTGDDLCSPGFGDPEATPPTPEPCDSTKEGCKAGERECVDCTTPGYTCEANVCTRSWRTFEDRDKDSLNACEERLLGTIDSLIDSDADGLPDKVEFVGGTNYLEIDPLQDIDFDGIVNREEVRGHTDPRSNDSQAQLDLAYRYEEVDEGIKNVMSFSPDSPITGITIKNVSSKSNGGVCFIKFNPGPPPTVQWKDSADTKAGGDFGPEVEISGYSDEEGLKVHSCRKDVEGNCTPESEERFITVLFDGEDFYPPKQTIQRVLVTSAPRNCLQFRVRNITLLETGIDPDFQQRGNNNIFVYFAQAPKNAKDSFGIFRVKPLLLNYLAGPPEVREPRIAEITLTDDEFVLFE